MLKKITLTACTLIVAAPLAAPAATLEERVEALERQNAELYHTLQEKKQAGLLSKITERISLSGLVEVEAGYESLGLEDGGDERSSDLVVSTAQLGFEAEVNDNVGATLILLFEEDDTEPIEVDEATIDYGRGPWAGRFGRQYVPFGVYPSHMISDPLTLELGETRQTAVLVGYEGELVGVRGYVFNGDADKEGEDDHIRDWGVSVTVRPWEEVEAGASFLSDLADTDADLLGGAGYRKRVGGWSAYAVAGWGPLQVSAEVLGAVRGFDAADLDEDADGTGDRPVAWNVEGAWGVTEAVEVAARVEGSRELGGQPELQYGVAVSWGVMEGVSVSAEYLHGEYDEDFGADEDGNVLDSRDLVTAQLSVEF